MDQNYKQQAQEALSSADFDKYALPDIQNLSLPAGDESAKIAALLDYVKNPYLFRVGDIGVHVVFSGKPGDTLQSHLRSLLASAL